MANNRKAATEAAIAHLNEIDVSGRSGQFFKESVENMTLAQFSDLMDTFEREEDMLSVVLQINDKKSVNTERNKKLAKKWGVEFYARVWQEHPSTGKLFLTPNKHPGFWMPVRRQIETIDNKISTSFTNKTIDAITGQVMGGAQTSRWSYPEVMVIDAKDLKYSTVEFMKYRGGDVKGRVEFNNLLRNTGNASLDQLLRVNTNVKSTESLEIYFKAMHWEVNLTH